ncbi:hypothetical protein [Amycolatopsis decaplanina]|uniref:Uncharacterized protein n=1 Tax=Amycolatopsis decaplanina DSM 44594 TaxID=1284240 RepID=M2XGL9_9PSEU|nr:hypothetical protein [Amycolatopsis decaplanina]EME60101.1 hypothetical protein H074_13777 [Amycolatopsis decaplanina DSM 44594]
METTESGENLPPDTGGYGEAPEAENDSGQPRTKEDALRALKGEGPDWEDSDRSQAIINEWIGRSRGHGDTTINYFAAEVHAGRDFIIGGAGESRKRSSGATLVAIDVAEIAEYTVAFVEPAGFRRAMRVLHQKRVVTLATSEGLGQRTAALELLRRALGVDEPALYKLDALEVLGDRTWVPPYDAAGYLVPRDDASLRLLSETWFDAVSKRLETAGAYLVVLTEPLSHELAQATWRTDFVVENLAAPYSFDVVTERLCRTGLFEREVIKRQLTEAGARPLLDARPKPQFAVDFAAEVIRVVSDGGDLRDAVARLDRPGELVREWFSEHKRHDQLAFVFAVAVLEGSSYLTLSDAAAQLFTRLPDAPDEEPMHFRGTLRKDHPWIELEAGDGLGAAELVKFRNPRLQPVVLTHIWYEYDMYRPVLLAWLKNLCGHQDVEVRARAGTAVGIIASGDLQHAMHRYLRPWARSKTAQLRQSIALALSVVGALSEHTDAIWTLLQDWAEAPENVYERRMASTAGLVAGSPWGLDDPSRALGVLQRLAEDDDWDSLEVIAVGILHLLDDGSFTEVLGALLAWTARQDESALVEKGLVAFTFAARNPASRAEPEKTVVPVRRPGLPTLLANAVNAPRELAELWARALANAQVRPMALDALREWLRLADRDPSVFRAVRNQILTVAGLSDLDCERLEYHLEQWADSEGDPSTSAFEILRELSVPA